MKIILKDGLAERYIWNCNRLVYVHTKEAAALYRRIVETIKRLLQAGLFNKQVTIEEKDHITSYIQSGQISNIRKFVDIQEDYEFKKNIDKLGTIIPIAGGYKIDVRTKQVTKRTVLDYFTYELESTYVTSMNENSNMFTKFIKEIFIDDGEYAFFRLLNGKLILPDMHDNNLVIWQHKIGGGGKSIWYKSVSITLGPRTTPLDREILYSRNKSISFEIAKLRNKTIGFIDESKVDDNSDENTTKNKKKNVPVNLARLQDLTGGGIRAELDKYQKASSMVGQEQTANIVLLGNGCIFSNNKKISSMERRVIYFTTLPYFRAISHKDYDSQDEYCKVKDPNLWPTLKENTNHIFTWLVNCAYDYLRKKASDSNWCLFDDQPQRFKDEWDKLTATVNIFETEQFEQFIQNECDYQEEHLIPLHVFVQGLTEYTARTYNNRQFSYTNAKVKDLFTNISIEIDPKPIVTRTYGPGSNRRNRNNSVRGEYVKHLVIINGNN